MASSAQPAHKLGAYLPCDEAAIFSALSPQGQSNSASVDRRLGDILLRAELISFEELRRGIIAQRVDRLASCALFDDFPRDELERLAPAFSEVSAVEGETVIRQGDLAEDLFVVASGRLMVSREQPSGAAMPLAGIGPGEPVGELGYLSGTPRTATVRALERCELLRASYASIRALIDATPRLAEAFLAVVVRRLLETTARLEREHQQLRHAEKSLDRLARHVDQDMLRNQQRMAMMLELANAIGDALDLETLVKRVVERVTDALACDRAAFFVVDTETDELWSMEWTGDDLKPIRIPRHSGLVGHAATHAQAVNIVDAYADARFNPSVDRETGYRTASVLCVPVINIDGTVTGVVECINKHEGAFDDDDEQLLNAICAQVSVALDNAMLHARAVQMGRYLENVHGSIASAIITLDAQARVVTTNRAAERLLSELLDKRADEDFERLLGFRNWPLRNLITRAYGTGKRVSESGIALYRGIDEKLTINASVLPLEDEDGVASGLVVVVEDVTSERRIKSAFSHYLAPAVIEQLLQNPDRLALGGEKRDVTVMFTDIADFTALSEGIDPGELVNLLHEYFDEACKVVLRYGGTIDKIVGDSLHVLFNAPVDQSDHHTQAVRCALELRSATERLNGRHRGELALGETRIGINTGYCVVGNFGGAERFDYTAHGDAINTAARLEGANKYLGTRICVSAATVDACRGIDFRPIGSLLVRGKQQAIDVFEPLSAQDAGSAHSTAYRDAYALLAAGDAGAGAAFDALFVACPRDGLAALHARRLANGEHGVVIRLDGK